MRKTVLFFILCAVTICAFPQHAESTYWDNIRELYKAYSSNDMDVFLDSLHAKLPFFRHNLEHLPDIHPDVSKEKCSLCRDEDSMRRYVQELPTVDSKEEIVLWDYCQILFRIRWALEEAELYDRHKYQDSLYLTFYKNAEEINLSDNYKVYYLMKKEDYPYVLEAETVGNAFIVPEYDIGDTIAHILLEYDGKIYQLNSTEFDRSYFTIMFDEKPYLSDIYGTIDSYFRDKTVLLGCSGYVKTIGFVNSPDQYRSTCIVFKNSNDYFSLGRKMLKSFKKHKKQTSDWKGLHLYIGHSPASAISRHQ